jgi:DNA-directed RNA polymerase specialized sigma24 family protein
MSIVLDPDEVLIERIRTGDRTAAVEFIQGLEPLLRRRFRHKLSAALRRVTDSEEMVWTLARRLDAYVLSGRLSEATLDQLRAVVMKIAENSLVDKLRVLRRLQEAEREDGPVAAALHRRLSESGVDAAQFERRVEEILGLLASDVDREIARLWMFGVEHEVIASDLGLSAEAVRKRWQRIKHDLRTRLGAA